MCGMAEPSSSKVKQPPLLDRVIQYGKLAFDPGFPEEARKSSQVDFARLVESTSTLALLPVLSLLVQPDRVNAWLRAPILAALSRLPLRTRGVQHTIEFILSVHPTTAASNAQGSTGRGAAISYEALNSASRLLSSPPAGMKAEEWFTGIAPQLFSLLQGEGEPGMDKAAAFVIGFGILGRKHYGAPDMPGWKTFVEPIFRYIDPSIIPEISSNTAPVEPVITLGTRKVLVAADDLARSLQRLSTLLSSHPNPALTKRLLKPILLPLWSLSYWPLGNGHTEDRYCRKARSLLKTLIQLSPTGKESSREGLRYLTPNVLSEILHNITFRGRSDPSKVCWTYNEVNDEDIQIQELPNDAFQRGENVAEDFSRIDESVESFVTLLEGVPDLKSEISNLFLQLFGNWITNSDRDKSPSIITPIESKDERNDLQNRMIEAKVIQKMMSSFPDKLVENTSQVLDVVDQVLTDFVTSESNGREETAAVALSLLNIVLTSPGSRTAPETDGVLSSIQASLQSISRKTQLEIAITAQNLFLFLRFQFDTDEPDTVPSTSRTDRQLEDRKSYNLAMSYLTTTDSPPPVRAQGLELISNLIKDNSSILNIPALLVLFSSLLQDSEEYIYLRVVKSFIQLSKKHPKSIMKDLIDRYVDTDEEAELDQRLRLGEALLQVIQSTPLAFSGGAALSVCEGLLFIASRRGYRPKAELEEKRRQKLKREQDGEAEEAWDGPVPQLDEVLEVGSDMQNEYLSQIVSGWESKRGTEDIRIRASALSILGSAIEANIAGISSNVISTTIDLSIHILTLEPEPEKGILRRSAILLIMSFVRALDSARTEGKKLGFGIVGQSLEDVRRILGYVEGADNDGLVREYATDVIEGLQVWQMNALIPLEQRNGAGMEMGELVGLDINPRVEDREGMRLRIEEVD